MPFAWVGAATSILGAVNGAQGSDATSTSQNTIDPRISKYIYGDDDTKMGGLLGDANNWYQQNKSGMNDQMRQGLNQQWQTYTDPSTMAGYRQQQNLGSGLLGAPVMGNPFSDGRVSLLGGPQGGSSTGTAQQQFPSYQPTYGGGQSSAAPPPGPFTAPPPPPAAAPAPAAPQAQYPGLTAQQPEQMFMDESGNMFVSRNGKPPVPLWGGDTYAGGA